MLVSGRVSCLIDCEEDFDKLCRLLLRFDFSIPTFVEIAQAVPHESTDVSWFVSFWERLLGITNPRQSNIYIIFTVPAICGIDCHLWLQYARSTNGQTERSWLADGQAQNKPSTCALYRNHYLHGYTMILITAEILLYQHARYKNLFDSVCLLFFSGGGGGRIVYCRYYYVFCVFMCICQRTL